jgi:hypothetical protein
LTADALSGERIERIEPVSKANLEILGIGGGRSLEGQAASGIAPGWPPSDFPVGVLDGDLSSHLWNERVEYQIGVRLLQEKGALRGLRLTFINSSGVRRDELVDHGYVFCAVECEMDNTLLELGLMHE